MLTRTADLTKRSGLKKIYNTFDDIYKRIDDLFSTHAGNQIIRGGVVAIYAKMSADSILRNLLFQKSASLAFFPVDRPPNPQQVFWQRFSLLSKRTTPATSLSGR